MHEETLGIIMLVPPNANLRAREKKQTKRIAAIHSCMPASIATLIRTISTDLLHIGLQLGLGANACATLHASGSCDVGRASLNEVPRME